MSHSPLAAAMTTEEMLSAFLAGGTYADIARRAGVSRQAVEQRLRPYRNNGTIPADLPSRRSAEATTKRYTGANMEAARRARWEGRGYTASFKATVLESVRRQGVSSAARAWGISETAIRAWRAAQAPAT